MHARDPNTTRILNPTVLGIFRTFSSTQWTTMDGYFLESHLKKAGTPISPCSQFRHFFASSSDFSYVTAKDF